MRLFISAVLLTPLLSPAPIQAAPISVDANGSAWEVSHYVNRVAQNSVGRFAGDTFSIGVENVVPNGKGGGIIDGSPTTGIAVQSGVTVTIRDTSNTLNPNGMGGGISLRPETSNLSGSWEITLTNENDTLTFQTPSICDSVANPNCASELIPDFVSNVRLSFETGRTTPTFRWEVTDSPDRLSVSIYDLNRRDSAGRADRLISTGLSPDTDTFTIPEEWGLEQDGNYAFRIDNRLVRTGGTNPSGSSQAGAALAETITFYDFSPSLPDIGEELLLPVSVELNPENNPVFNFDNPVLAEQIQYYDPLVAIGYDYQIGAQDPFFNSFILPEIGDDMFSLHLWNGTEYAFEEDVLAGTEYFFGDGTDRFRILGIETDAALDPLDPTAFVTGLSFVADGRFTGTMSPIVANVPLPASLLLLGGALGGMAFWRRRRRAA